MFCGDFRQFFWSHSLWLFLLFLPKSKIRLLESFCTLNDLFYEDPLQEEACWLEKPLPSSCFMPFLIKGEQRLHRYSWWNLALKWQRNCIHNTVFFIKRYLTLASLIYWHLGGSCMSEVISTKLKSPGALHLYWHQIFDDLSNGTARCLIKGLSVCNTLIVTWGVLWYNIIFMQSFFNLQHFVLTRNC